MEFLPRRRKSLSSKALQLQRRSAKSPERAPDSSPPPSSPPNRPTAQPQILSSCSDYENMAAAQPSGNHGNQVLKDVVAYVEVRTKSENRSNSVRRQLELLGAVVVKRFTSEEAVTHVVWKDGNLSTREKAVKRGVHLVSVLWVDSCKQRQQHADETLYPITTTAVESNSMILPKPKRLKSMQPKSFEEDVENSTERIHRKRKKKERENTPRPCLGSPGLGTTSKASVFVPETQDPCTPQLGTPVPGTRGTPSLIPDTPASMRACLDALSRVRSAGITPSAEAIRLVVGESPTSSAKADSLQKRLSFSPSSGSRTHTDGVADSRAGGKAASNKGRRSATGQQTTAKDAAKVRRLSLRIEKSLKEHPVIDLCCTAETDEGSARSANSTNELIPARGCSKTSPGRATGAAKGGSAAGRSVASPEGEAPSRGESSTRKRRKLLSTAGSNLPSECLAQPTRSGRKEAERQPGRGRPTSKTSRSLGDRFAAAACDSPGSNERPVDDRRGGGRGVNPKPSPPSRSSARSDAEHPTGGDSRKRKREADARSSGPSSDETGKPAKKHREDQDESPSSKASSCLRVDAAGPSRRSLEDFATGGRRRRPEKAGRGKRRPASSASALTLPSADLSAEPPTGRKASRSLSLAGNYGSGRRGERAAETATGSRAEIVDAEALSDESGSDLAAPKYKKKAKGRRASKPARPVKKLKPNQPSLVMTSVHGEDQDLVTSVVSKLGRFVVVDQVTAATTHLVCGESRRTLNFLGGIARGCWLLSLEWVLKSLEVGEWLPEAQYEIQDPFPAAKLARLERESAGTGYRQTIFSALGPVYVADQTSPPRPALCELLTLCGGTVADTPAKAALCIGSSSSCGRNQTAQTVSEKWLLDSITQHRQLAFDDYNL